MRRTGLVLRFLVAVMFLFSAVGMFVDRENVADELQLATWFIVIVTVVKGIGGLGMLASFWINRLAQVTGLLFVMLMTGALVTHIRVDDPLSNFVTPALLLVLSGVIAGIAFWEDLELRDSLATRLAVPPDYTERRQTNA